MSTEKTRANRVARLYGASAATSIVYGNDNLVLKRTACGYRKKSTNEYVSAAYYRKGFSSCYYQSAECVVQLMKKEEVT